MELDHVFCMVRSDDDWAARLAAAGWRLDAGSTHAGQGTRNRRLRWADCYLELLWVHDAAEARHNALRLDQRAAWERTGASPFGIGLRGKLSDAERVDYWLYDGLPMPVWVHRDNEEAPERPFVFALDLDEHRPPTVANPGALQVLHHTGPAPARLPGYRGPRIAYTPGPHRLDLVIDRGQPVAVTAELALRTA
jgi:Glyoxalase-like domain